MVFMWKRARKMPRSAHSVRNFQLLSNNYVAFFNLKNNWNLIPYTNKTHVLIRYEKKNVFGYEFDVMKNDFQWSRRWQESHSRIEHYFYSNLYGRAPRGARSVKRTGREKGSILRCVCTLIFSPNWRNFENPLKIKKICQKWRDDLSKFVQYGLNISKKHIKLLIIWSFKFLSGGTPYNYLPNNSK